MQTIGRWLVIAFGLGLAISAAIIFLPLALISDPLLGEVGPAIAEQGIEGLVLLFLSSEAVASFAGGLFAIVWMAIVAICVAPVTITGVIGEAAGIRSIFWYAGATGLLAGAMPWILRAAKGTGGGAAGAGDSLARAAELRISLIFLLTGLAAGLVYWLVAGRNAGAAERRG
ncbi:MAG: hypothetical protein KDJ29_05160 [Hyphomicrobiales bacterium]|nr:hypothetical protein [Hyphomicrobiales bacterium]